MLDLEGSLRLSSPHLVRIIHATPAVVYCTECENRECGIFFNFTPFPMGKRPRLLTEVLKYRSSGRLVQSGTLLSKPLYHLEQSGSTWQLL